VNATGDSRDAGHDRSPGPAGNTGEFLLLTLTAAAGVVDAVSYLGLGRIFTANMTGNIVFLALAIGEWSLLTALHSLGALIGFCLGALFAGRMLPGHGPGGKWDRRVTGLVSLELAFLLAFALVWLSVAGEPNAGLLYVLIGLSSFGMGIQNAIARHLGVPGLTTTVVTMALTGFMVDLPALGMSGKTQRRALGGVVLLFAGAAVGAALMVTARPFAPFLTVGAVLAVVVFLLARPSPLGAHGA
jgi:uncharacterized membrane protein YoaK (UPF0700 family)